MKKAQPGQELHNAVALLDRLNQAYPQHASDETRGVVSQWQALFEPAQTAPSDTDGADNMIQERANSLLCENDLEGVLDQLSTETNEPWDYERLIQTVGRQGYLRALKREALELQSNAVSHQQAAELWTTLGRPPPGTPDWSARIVADLIAESPDL